MQAECPQPYKKPPNEAHRSLKVSRSQYAARRLSMNLGPAAAIIMELLDLLIVLATLCAAALSAGPVVSWDAQNIVAFSAPDALHQAHLAIGTSTLCAMRSSDRGAGIKQGDSRNPPSAESLWATGAKAKFRLDMCRTWAWRNLGLAPKAADFVYQGWDQAKVDLSAQSHRAPSSRPWIFKRFKHGNSAIPQPYRDQTYTVVKPKMQRYSCTGAVIQVAVNANDRIVFFQPGIAPKVATSVNWNHEARDQELPQYRAPSDFAFMEFWPTRRRANTPKSTLSYCAVSDVKDLANHRLIARYVLARGMFDLENWPAANSIFNTNTPEGLALLGSPAAKPCVSLLLQHKKDLEIKHIVSVTVFRSPTRQRSQDSNSLTVFPNMVFKVENVPEPLLLPDPGAGFVPSLQVVVPDPRAGLPPRPNPAVP